MTYQAVGKALNVSDNIKSLYDLMLLSRKGLFKSAIDSLAQLLELSNKELVDYLPISERTLQRYEEDRKLSPELSDHVIQLARVYARAEEVFGDRDKAVQWLKYPNYALGAVTPISCLDNFSGIQLIMDELGRIEYGVYA